MSETRITLRLPSALAEQVAAQANTNNRSMNGEIVARLEGGPEALRDKIAIAAMTVTLRNLGVHYHDNEQGVADCKALTAERAYQMADAMLAAREAGQP